MLTSRPFAGEQDLSLLRAFLVSLRLAIGEASWHVGDLTWRFFQHSIRFDLTSTVRLWYDESELVGFGIQTPVSRSSDPSLAVLSFDLQVAPRPGAASVVEEIVAWAQEASRTLSPIGGARVIAERALAVESVYEQDPSLFPALERLGFERRGWSGALLSRPLHEPIPEPRLPEGFTVRSVRGEEKIPERAGAHREAFHPSRLSDDQYRRLMRLPDYRQDLDRIVVSADGTVASFCLVWLDETHRACLFEPVGTRSLFQRRGLAKALLYNALGGAAALGMAQALVGPIQDTSPALRLYESVGFRPCTRATELVRISRR